MLFLQKEKKLRKYSRSLFRLIVLFGLIAVTFITHRFGQSHPKIFVHPSKILSESEEFLEDQAIFSPNGEKIAYISILKDSYRKSILRITDPDGTNFRKITAKSEFQMFSSPAWSPDSTKLAYFSIYPTILYLYDIYEDKHTPIADQNLKNFEGKTILDPPIGKFGKTYLRWLNNYEVEFINTEPIFTEYISLNIETGEFRASKIDNLSQPANHTLKKIHFSQRDPQWAQERLGGCDDQTMKSAGCAVSAIAMNLALLGEDLNPKKLNTFLSQNSFFGYVNGCDVKWYYPPNFVDGIWLKGAYFNEKNYERLDYELSRNNPVIVGFNYVPSTKIPHWVVVTSKVKNDYLILDPWNLEHSEKYISEIGSEFDHMIIYQRY